MASKGRGPIKRLGYATVGLVITALALAACSGGASGPDSSARAQLDPVSGEIALPMDEFAFYGRHEDVRTFEAATQAVLGECMRRNGFSYSLAQVQADPATDLDDRTFGIWEEGRAARFGWGFAVSPLNAALAKAQAAGGAAWSTAYNTCNETDETVIATLDIVTPPQDEYLNSLVSRLESEALASAQGDSRWREARVPWVDCLAEVGLAAEDGERYISKQSRALLESGDAENGEEAIRLATLEARCNNETRLTQTLADIEASYQQPLIDANEAALSAEKDRKQQLLEAARNYVSTNG